MRENPSFMPLFLCVLVFLPRKMREGGREFVSEYPSDTRASLQHADAAKRSCTLEKKDAGK